MDDDCDNNENYTSNSQSFVDENEDQNGVDYNDDECDGDDDNGDDENNNNLFIPQNIDQNYQVIHLFVKNIKYSQNKVFFFSIG